METEDYTMCVFEPSAFRPSYEGWKHNTQTTADKQNTAFRPSYEGWKLYCFSFPMTSLLSFRPSYEGWKLGYSPEYDIDTGDF